jgi:hypothetical protein
MTTQQTWADSPLLTAIERIRAHMRYATIVTGPPPADDPNWVTVAQMAQPEIADRPITRVMEKYEATQPVAGTYSFRALLGLPLQIIGYCYATARRVPIIEDNLRYHTGESLYHIALVEPRALVLPADALAGQPGIETVCDEAALKEALFAQVAGLLEPLVAAWAPRKLINRNNAWASALDGLAYGFQMAGRHELTLDESWRQLEQLYAERSFPSRRRPVRFLYEVDGEADELVVRAGCCLWYMLPKMRTAQYKYCTSCYLESDDVRLEKLTAWKRRQAAEKQAA